MFGKEAQKFIERLVTHLAGKWKSPYSHVMAYQQGYLPTRINITFFNGLHKKNAFFKL